MLLRGLLSAEQISGRAHDLSDVLTSNVIHDIGSSAGMDVLLTKFRVHASSSNSTVKIAPGGVHVPIIRWCFILGASTGHAQGRKSHGYSISRRCMPSLRPWDPCGKASRTSPGMPRKPKTLEMPILIAGQKFIRPPRLATTGFPGTQRMRRHDPGLLRLDVPMIGPGCGRIRCRERGLPQN
jgi:hypothetical protein